MEHIVEMGSLGDGSSTFLVKSWFLSVCVSVCVYVCVCVCVYSCVCVYVSVCVL